MKLEKLEMAAYMANGSPLGGTVSFEATLAFDGHTAHLEGTTEVDRLVLAKGGSPLQQPVRLEFAADYDTKARRGRLTRGDAHLAQSVTHLTGTFEQRGASAILDLALAAPAVRALDIQQALRSLAIGLPGGASLQGGTANVQLAIAGSTSAPIVTGPVHIDNLTVTGFDLGTKIRAIATLAGIETGANTVIQSFDGKVRVGPEGERFDGVNAIIQGMGSLTGTGSIGANQALDFQLTAQLAKNGGVMGNLLRTTGLGQLSNIPFRITGSTDNPKFVPDVRSILQVSKGQNAATDASKQPANPLNQVMNLFKKKK